MTVNTTNVHAERGLSAYARALETTDQTTPAVELGYRSFLKRAFETTIVLLSLPFVLPIIAVMTLMVACDGYNPFYSQKRVGRNGREFRMWKIRTMVPDADLQLQSHLASDPHARAEWELNQKLKSDPRITWIGRIMRKTSLDELPQLFNVLNGTMSLVGPRPMMPHQKDAYPGQAYYRLRPGITGFWQISDRNSCSFADRARFDDAYEAVMSFKTDMRTLVRTVTVVFRGTGY